ncbi:hypothetical protein [Catellatospora chokoriensis]|uniref:Uncharacterized protein n=1 Tax=Catellatospora chokoriensis TaxID=310353 RepID=A0A8J3KD68_9ACTN|nr:hypothetical protein [Catellatospora chokoriensis]GIF92889.1 hypothetical protein Cch02nite_63330 [Catellatospora chokoriensis]
MSELTARWYGHTLVIGVDDGLPRDLVEALPSERDRHTVLLAGDAPLSPEPVARLIGEELPRAASIRLACSAAGTGPIAQQLADRLRIDVVAPLGPTMLVGPGSLFVVRQPRAHSWRLHRPGERAREIGAPRHPAPQWQVPLPRQPFGRLHGLAAHDLPAGFWLHRPQRRPLAPDDPAYAIEVDAERVVVLVGQPDREPPSPRKVYRWLSRLPRTALGRLVLMPYGPWGSLLDTVAGRLSTDLRVTVGRTAGLPVRSRGTTYHVPVDVAGRTGPRPVAQTMSYLADEAAPRIDSWISPTSGQLVTGRPVEDVGDRWLVEVVRGGYWLREADAPHSDDVRLRPADGGDAFLVDVTGAEAHDLARLLAARLPADIRDSLRFEQRTEATAQQVDPRSAGHRQKVTDHDPDAAAAPVNSAIPAPLTAPAVPAVPPVVSAPQVPPAPPLLTAPQVGSGPAAVAAPATLSAAAVTVPRASVAAPPSPPQATDVAAPPPPGHRTAEPEPAPPSTTRRSTAGPTARDAAPPRAASAAPAAPTVSVVPTAPASAALPPLPPLRRQPGAVPAPAPRRSNVHEQRRVREHLGARYDVHARDVAQLLVRLPGIRPGVDESADAVVADLVAVAATLRPGRTGTEPALRACLLSGLNRLPTALGPVRAWAPADPVPHRAGDVLISPGLLRAGGQAPDGERHDAFTVYSLTGRRPGVLSDRDEVLFAPGTVFAVLDTVTGPDGTRRVLLRELGGPDAGGPSTEQVLESLRADAARRR